MRTCEGSRAAARRVRAWAEVLRARDAAPRRRAVPSGLSDRSESGSAGLEPVRFSSRRDKYLAKSARASSRASPHPRAPSASRADVRRTLASSSWCSLWRPSRASRARRSLVVARTRARSSPIPPFRFSPERPARRVARASRTPRARPPTRTPSRATTTSTSSSTTPPSGMGPNRCARDPLRAPARSRRAKTLPPRRTLVRIVRPVIVRPVFTRRTLSALVPAGWHLPHLRR